MSPWVWFAAAVVLSIAEILGGEFVLLMLGGGALVTALVAIGFNDPSDLWIQLLVFALVSVALVVLARPPLLRRFRPTAISTGVDAVIGSPATVISTVDADGGQVKIGGEVWSAIGVEGHRSLPPGTPVTVVEVRGATAVVIWGR
ncbi:NfeD family protein [Nakamurella aerolata]|uniref:NfeD family protein n=1 Tax=Nakamurella aerolata TaxID=1656892 RepID=A0A849ABQ9_9ACTN|nr:NfeD family protein [Nakamurella aerolata]NNG34332.1 NfeD family protein [Nakamurella aerolata]